MLISLHVKNLALIKETEVNFKEGLNYGILQIIIIHNINMQNHVFLYRIYASHYRSKYVRIYMTKEKVRFSPWQISQQSLTEDI